MTHFLTSIELHNQVLDSPSSISFFILLGVAIVLVYLKTNKNLFFKNLFSTVSSSSTYFDSLLQTGITSSGSVLLQVSFLFLSSLGLCELVQPEISISATSLARSFLLVAGLYVFQFMGLYIFSIIKFSGDTDFLRKRLAYNEFNALLLFVGLIAVFYLPFSTSYFNIILFCVVWLVNMVGSSAYLLGNISVFHIILYLCILELIPVLFLIKYL